MTDPYQREPREKEISLCPCKSKSSYMDCCMPYHYGIKKPETAEQLMRSRYCAYFFRRVDYLVDTWHPDKRTAGLKNELKENVHEANWKFLNILATSKGQKGDKTGKVEFSADYYVGSEKYTLEECSRFRKHKGSWKYLDDKG